MISRRGFFGMLAGLAAAPVLAPLAKLFPQTTYTTYVLPDNAWVKIKHSGSTKIKPYKVDPAKTYEDYTMTFRCGTDKMGTLWWSKDKS